MLRRTLLHAAGGSIALFFVGCKPAGSEDENRTVDAPEPFDGDAGTLVDAAEPTADACEATVTLYDTHAMAMYFDGTTGPKTGIITVDMVVAGETVDFVFWHGHGGVSHRFKLEPVHCAALLRRERVMIQTTTVDNHSHTLFIDPMLPQYRVAGAPPETVPAC